MKKNRWIALLCVVIVLLAAVTLVVLHLRAAANMFRYSPDDTVRVIFDTDIDTDVDDMGALAALHSYIREGRAELLAAVGSCKSGYAAACLDAVNTFYGLPDVPVGVAPDCPSSGESKYQKYIAENYPHDAPQDDEASPALQVYRQCLSQAEDDSVVIVVVGPLNNLDDLLRSGGDENSPLTGEELVRKKVKLCVAMGGRFPDAETASEYNVKLDPEAANYVSEHCPAPIMWCGWEVGSSILTGSRIGELSQGNPVREAYALFSGGTEGFTHSSWDLTAVMYAVEGTSVYWLEERGSAQFFDSTNAKTEADIGCSRWHFDEYGKDAYLISRWPDTEIAEALDERMVLSEN